MDRSDRVAKIVSEAPESALPTDRLLDIDTIRNASRKPPERLCGVYFLWMGDSLIYVGQSVDVLSRLLSHGLRGQFDSFTMIECPKEELADLETAYILLFKPPLNCGVVSTGYAPGLKLFRRTAAEYQAFYKSQRA